MKRIKIALSMSFALTLVATAAATHDYKAGSLSIAHPWSRATPGGAKVGGGYVMITNTGRQPDRLLGGWAAVAERFELHESRVENGVSTMRPLADGLEIQPGETLELRPGGKHIMLVNLKESLKAGARFPGALVFEKVGTVPVEFAVEGLGGTGESHGDHGGHAQ